MSIDYLIVGQGLCGTFLSNYLIKAGKKVIVIDENKPFTAGKVASGVINPVTGRRIVRTWRIEELLPFAMNAYNTLSEDLGAQLVRQCSVIDFHPSLQMKEAFEKRLPEETEYLHTVDESYWQQYFNFHFGGGAINPCLLIDINSMLSLWRKKLLEDEILIEETFEIADLAIETDAIHYKHFSAEKIIFCDGVNGVTNPFFKNLPYSPNKGEAIIARIPGLEATNIYKHGLSMVPWKDDLFWIGSTYEWEFPDTLPTQAFKNKVTALLKYWLKLPFEIVDHVASIRPANMERRPFVGLHPKFTNVGLLNGMGTKGCSLAPFFAKQLADQLTQGTPIDAEVDVSRFEKILARTMK
jgi:glycine/D-amino acid oxidase-like deaminating enzyme